jgi:hypothetical protein
MGAPHVAAHPCESPRFTSLNREHFRAWSVGRELQEIPEEIRDAGMWAYAEKFGPTFLGLVWEGSIEGREELLAAGVDFNLAE